MDPTAVQVTIEGFAGFLLKYFVALAAVGAFAMALTELWKKFFDSRTRFHARVVADWFADSADAFETPVGVPGSSDAAYRELIHLTTGLPLERHADRVGSVLTGRGDVGSRTWIDRRNRAELALFALELGQMMGHIQDAADTVLAQPEDFPSLYRFLTDGAQLGDVAAWYDLAGRPPALDAKDQIDREAAKRRVDIHARLKQTIKRKLDAFQLFQSERWTRGNQLAANVVGAVVLFAALCWSPWNKEAGFPSGAQWLTYMAISIFGGMLAPIAKDMVDLLRRVRQGG